MSYIGGRQRFTVTIATAAAGEVARIKNCLGAIAILVKVYAGSTAGAVTLTAEGLDAGATIAGSQGIAFTVDKPGTMVANGAAPQADYAVVRYAPGTAPGNTLPIPTPEISLIGQIATADATGTIIDCWAVFAEAQSYSISALPS